MTIKTAPNNPTSDPAPALTRGLALLDHLQAHGPTTLEHLAHACGWPKSSVSRLLSSLESAGTVRRDPRSRAYHPLQRLVPIQSGTESLRDAAAALLDALCHQTHQTVELHLFNPPGHSTINSTVNPPDHSNVRPPVNSPAPLVMIDRREPHDAEVSVRARVGSVRDLTEFESLAQTYFAHTTLPLPKTAWHWQHGTKRRVTRKLADATLTAVRRDRVATDLGINSNSVRRYTAPLFSRTTTAPPPAPPATTHPPSPPTLLGCIAVAQVCAPHAIEPDPKITRAVHDTALRFAPHR